MHNATVDSDNSRWKVEKDETVKIGEDDEDEVRF